MEEVGRLKPLKLEIPNPALEAFVLVMYMWPEVSSSGVLPPLLLLGPPNL